MHHYHKITVLDIDFRKSMRKCLMTILIFSAVVLGLVIGIILNRLKREPYTNRQIMYIKFPGELLLNLLKGAALPLTISCLISAVSSFEMVISKRIGWQLVLYIALTKIEAVILGLLLALVIRPGAGGYNKDRSRKPVFIKKITTIDSFLDLVRNMFPPNILGMNMRQYETVLVKPVNGSDNLYDWDVKEGGVMVNSMNMLGIVNCALIFGASLATLHVEAKPLADIFHSLSQVSMMITTWILWLAPILLVFLVTAQVVKMKSDVHILQNMGLFIATVIIGHLTQCLVVYPIIYFLLVWKNPFILMRQFLDAIITAFVTSSSMATMPFSIRSLEREAKIDRRLVRFVIPVAHAISMDGAAIYQGASTIFVSQLNEIALDLGSIVAVVFLGAAASVSAEGIPHGSIVVIIMVLNGVGLPIHDVSLLFAVDWLLDRTATVTNILGDAIGVGILAAYNRKLLESLESDASMEGTSGK